MAVDHGLAFLGRDAQKHLLTSLAVHGYIGSAHDNVAKNAGPLEQ